MMTFAEEEYQRGLREGEINGLEKALEIAMDKVYQCQQDKDDDNPKGGYADGFDDGQDKTIKIIQQELKEIQQEPQTAKQ